MRLDDANITGEEPLECKETLALDKFLRSEREKAFIAACESYGHTNEVENYRRFYEFENRKETP